MTQILIFQILIQNVKFYDPKLPANKDKNFMTEIKFEKKMIWFPLHPNPESLNIKTNPVQKIKDGGLFLINGKWYHHKGSYRTAKTLIELCDSALCYSGWFYPEIPYVFNFYGYKDKLNKILEVNKIFDKYHKEVISDGDLYRIASPFTDGCFHINCVSKDKSKAIGLYVNLKEVDSVRIIFRGLDKNKQYKNSFDNKVYSGEQYEKDGINISHPLKKYSSQLIILEEVR